MCGNRFVAVGRNHYAHISAVLIQLRKHLPDRQQVVILVRDDNHNFFVFKLRVVEAVIDSIVRIKLIELGLIYAYRSKNGKSKNHKSYQQRSFFLYCLIFHIFCHAVTLTF